MHLFGSNPSPLRSILRLAATASCLLTASLMMAETPKQGAAPHLGDTISKAKETYDSHQEWTEFTPGKPVCQLYSGGISILVRFDGKVVTSISYHLLGRMAKALSPEFIQSHEDEQSKTHWSDDGTFQKGRIMKSEDGLYAYCTPGNYSLILFTKAGFEAYKKDTQTVPK